MKFPKSVNQQHFQQFKHLPNVFEINPNATDIIYFLHGGGFQLEMAPYYYDFFERLALTTNHRIIVPVYPKTPKYWYQDIFEMVSTTYDYIINQLNLNPKKITFMGDSAGGNLCFSLCMYLIHHQKPIPAKIISVSPWLNLVSTNPKMKEIEPYDPFLNIEMLNNFAKLYAKNIPLTDPRISPFYDNLSLLPETHIIFGTNDILYPDYEEALKKFPNLNGYTFENETHVFALEKEKLNGFNKIVECLTKKASK